MFLKCRERRKDGKTHRSWSIVESRRYRGGKVAHRHVFYLGEINDSERAAWERTIEVIDERDGEARQMALFPADRRPRAGGVDCLQVRLSGMRLEHPRQWGACWLADELWRRLGLDSFFGERLPVSREGTDWGKVVRILAVYRLLSPGSEWRLHRHWFNTTALGDLLGVDARAVQDDTLYRALDLLLAEKEELFSHLNERWRDLFGAKYEILLYDLTSTYFECSEPAWQEDPRRFGYSRDKRGDCVQVVVALVVTPEGLPLAYEMMPGNTVDNQTLREMLETITRRYGQADRIWVMDRGIPTEEILTELRRGKVPVRYLVGTPKGRLTRLESALAELPWQDVRSELRVKLLPADGELYVLAESGARKDKERGMRRRHLKRYWMRLGELKDQKQSRDKLLKKLGVAQHAAGRIVEHLVEVDVSENGVLTLQPRPRKAACRAPARGPLPPANQHDRRGSGAHMALLYAALSRRGSLPYLEGRPGPEAHLSPQAGANRGAPLRLLPRVLPDDDLAPDAEGLRLGTHATGRDRKTGDPPNAGRPPAHHRRPGTASRPPYRAGPGCRHPARAPQTRAASTTTTEDHLPSRKTSRVVPTF